MCGQIVAENVSYFYKSGVRRKIKALDGFSIHVEKGDIFALLGPNGAGKTTAMYCLLGLIKPHKGKVEICGEVPYPGSPVFEKIAYLPEEPHYPLYLTIEEEINYYLQLYNAEVKKSLLEYLLEKFELKKFRRLKLSKCSKGMKQKVGIIQALAHENAEILFLDEPTRGLDPIATITLKEILFERSKKGTTIFLNSHVLTEVELMCNRVSIMDNGRVLVEDSLKNLLKIEKETYEVEFQKYPEVPSFINILYQDSQFIRGFFNKDKVEEFFKFVKEKNLEVYKCSLKKDRLEEVFERIIKGNSNEKEDTGKH